MAAPASAEEFLDLVRKSGVVDDKRLDAYVHQLRASGVPDEPGKLAGLMVRDGLLTHFQAEQFLLGKWRRFTIGKYKVLERLGSGGMGSVYLCEHKFMRRRVAVKVLPAAKAEDPSSLERFYREARAAAALDHPNIVRAYDIDQDENLHFLVMEYVDGASLQEIIKKSGPMHVLRAAHYVRQAAIGLQHAHEAGLVHRDIKPGNLLIDRAGTMKVLDMGLARFFHDEEDILTKKYDESVLGTADYLAPEQALDSHGVDIRADIYSLGATFYFCLTGQPPFNEGTVAQKLIWHQTRQPKPIRTIRPEVPEQVAVIIDRMMSKDRNKRFQTPAQVAEALAPLTTRPIPPPPESEMPRLSPAAMAGAETTTQTLTPSPASPVPQRPVAPNVATPAPRAMPAPQVAAMPAQARSQAVQPTPDPRRVATPPPRPQQRPTPAQPNNGAFSAPPARADEPAPNWGDLVPASPPQRVTTTRTGDKKKAAFDVKHLLAAVKSRPRFWIIVAASAFVLLLLLALVLKMALGGGGKSKSTSRAEGSGRRLTVTNDPARGGEFRSIAKALAQANPGDRIVVTDEIHQELLDLGQIERRPIKDVIIEGDPGLGKRVVWRPPPAVPTGQQVSQLIALTSCEGLTLKGFHLKGQNGTIQALDIITLWGRCPGLRLEDLQFEVYNRSAVKLINCCGESKRPIVFKGLRMLAPLKPDGTSLTIEASQKYDPKLVEHVRIEGCRFEGPFRAAVQIGADEKCEIKDLDFFQNRFFSNRTGDGLLYKKQTPGRPIVHLTLDSNTFCGLADGLRLESVPLDDKSKIVCKNNLFVNVGTLVQMDDDPVVAPVRGVPEAPARWIWFNEGEPWKDAPKGAVFFRSRPFNMPKDFYNASLDVTCDDTCTVYLNGNTWKSPTHNVDGRVRAYDVTPFLKPEGNVIAVHGINNIGPAGLLVQITCLTPGNPPARHVPVITDGNWRASKESPGGWHEPQFKEEPGKWVPVRDMDQYGKGPMPHKNLTWESVVRDQLAKIGPKVLVAEGGNVRDPGTPEGIVPLKTGVVGDLNGFSQDPNSEQFLRYPKTSPLATAGTDKKPVGVPPTD